MASSVTKIYLIDTDVLGHTRYRPDSAHIYESIGALGKKGLAKTVAQVLVEIRQWNDVVAAMAAHHVSLQLSVGLQYSLAIQEQLQIVHEHAPHLWEPTGPNNLEPADPWLVAVAMGLGYTLVTNENTRSPKKMPAVCKLPAINAKCITGAEFLIETGIVTEMRPEDLDTDKFFRVQHEKVTARKVPGNGSAA